MDDGVRAAEVYDAMAEAYAADEGNAYNALYERPAMVAALGPVDGLRVLDAGCGAGALAVELLARGAAAVVGVDASERMVAVARERLASSPSASFRVGDLTGGAALAGFADGSFDVAASSLALHYVRDWEPLLRELRRVVVPGGRIVVSTHHPELVERMFPDGDPQALEVVHDRWVKGGRAFDVRFWRRPWSQMTSSFAAAGLVVEETILPRPAEACREADPVAWERLSTLPWFVLFALRAAS
jgi:ubiquinone/menaquinone biosynthesis C-methylase UbiE